METILQIIIKGRPVTKKNSQRMALNKSTGRMFPIQSKAYAAYERDSLRQITGDKKLKLVGRLNLCCKYWMADRRQTDLLNLLAATSDILEKAGVVVNDKDFVRVDGSEIVGVDKHNPRVEICISKLDGEGHGYQEKLIG